MPEVPEVTVTLTLNQPAALGRRPRGTAPVETYRHLPGSVLRGALAAAWIGEFGAPQGNARREEFIHLFEGAVRYGPLFDPYSAVVPLSVLRCKYRPREECRGSYVDRVGQPGERQRCARCAGAMVAGRGEVEFFGGPSAVVEHARVRLGEDERAVEGQLFTRRSLSHRRGSAARELRGRIAAPAGNGHGHTDWLNGTRALYIGGRRSISGAATYTARPDPAASSVAAAVDPEALVSDGHLTVRLLSPAILVDSAGRPAGVPDTALLSTLLDTEVTVDRRDCWTRPERVGGWNALTNLPKPEELAVSAGSVFRLRLAATPTASALAALHHHGLGLRRAEGFGWIELGPWTLPRVVADQEPLPREELYTEMARLLYETGAGARCLNWLRECALRWRQGEPGGDAFMRLPAAEGLMLNERVTRNLRILLDREESDVRELERIRLHLEAQVREGRL